MTQLLNQDEKPLFGIGAVSRMTNISEATLRVWERRYNFPQSARTEGGHRLYSQQEVTRLQWVKQRVDEGMQVSQAIRALQQAQREGDALRAVLPFVQPQEESSPLDNYQQRLLEALLRHDTNRASTILAEAQTLYSLEVLILDVIGPTFHDIGEGWSRGEVDVATEHFATNFLRHHLLMWMRMGPPAYQVNPVVLACAPGELHEGSLLMLGVLLRRLRWPVIYLGQTMPLSELAAFIEDVHASMVVFVAMTEEPACALMEWPHQMPEIARSQYPVIGFGGRAFLEQPELASRISGVWLGKTLPEGVETLNRMLHEMNPLPR